MTELHAQLGLFAAIDEAVLANPSLAGTVEGFLPGTTGIGQAGWSRELLDFMGTLPARPGPDATPALGAPPPEPMTFPGSDAALAEVLATAPRDPGVAGRALYALTILSKIGEAPKVPDSPRLREILSETDLEAVDPLTALLSLTTPQTAEGERTEPEPDVAGLRQALGESPNRSGYLDAMETHGPGSIDPCVARAAVCTGALRRVKGRYCTLLATDSVSPLVTMDAVKKVIDPWNWQHLSAFFCEMEPLDPYDGWSRVREHVSTLCDTYRMDTELRYWKVEDPTNGIYLNYDLAEHRSDCGLVEVDNGYIWVAPGPPPAGGVRIRTSKEVRICGLSATATAALACFSGWADVGNQMLCDRVLQVSAEKDLKPPLTPFRPSPDHTQAPRRGSGPSAPTDATTVLQPRIVAGFRGNVITEATNHVDEFVSGAAKIVVDTERLWRQGLNRDGIANITTSVGALLTKTALSSYDSAMRNYKPADSTTPGPVEGTNDDD